MGDEVFPGPPDLDCAFESICDKQAEGHDRHSKLPPAVGVLALVVAILAFGFFVRSEDAARRIGSIGNAVIAAVLTVGPTRMKMNTITATQSPEDDRLLLV